METWTENIMAKKKWSLFPVRKMCDSTVSHARLEIRRTKEKLLQSYPPTFDRHDSRHRPKLTKKRVGERTSEWILSPTEFFTCYKLPTCIVETRDYIR